MLTHSLELVKCTIHTGLWRNHLSASWKSVKQRGAVDTSPLPVPILISACLYSPGLCILGLFWSAPPTLSEIIKPGEKYGTGPNLFCSMKAVGVQGAFGNLQVEYKVWRIGFGKEMWWGRLLLLFSYKPFCII